MSGVSLEVIAEAMGHTSTTVTKLYAHLHPTYTRREIAKMRAFGTTEAKEICLPENPGVGSSILPAHHFFQAVTPPTSFAFCPGMPVSMPAANPRQPLRCS
jgi:hypothetical protein